MDNSTENKIGLKSFQCIIHPQESVQRILKGSPSPLKCIQCLISQNKSEPFTEILTLEEFLNIKCLDSITPHSQMNKKLFEFSSSIVTEFESLLTQSQKAKQQLDSRLNEYQELIEFNLNAVQQQFLAQISLIKKEIAAQIKQQQATFDSNINFIKHNITKLKNCSNDFSKIFKSKEAYLQEINEANSYQEFEMVIKEIQQQEDYLDLIGDSQDVSQFITNYLESINSEIRAMLEKRVKIPDYEPSNVMNIAQMLNAQIEKFLPTKNIINDPILPISLRTILPIRSKIIQNSAEQNKILNWVKTFSGFDSLSLLYRGTRDGFKSSSMYTKCQSAQNTLVIAKSIEGKVFGGFSDREWTLSSCGYNHSRKSWLFSLDKNQIYRVKYNEYQNAVKIVDGQLANFGGGYDLHFAEDCDKNEKSYSELGYSYSTNNSSDPHSQLAGSKNFQIEELEIFNCGNIVA